jgi:hypothetical protein
VNPFLEKRSPSSCNLIDRNNQIVEEKEESQRQKLSLDIESERVNFHAFILKFVWGERAAAPPTSLPIFQSEGCARALAGAEDREGFDSPTRKLKMTDIAKMTTSWL